MTMETLTAEIMKKLAQKVPTWTETVGLNLPPRLAMEQCSGEAAARYKAAVVRRLFPNGGTMADLTGGFGVDFSFMAPCFEKAVYIERQEDLCRLVRHNFPLLGLKDAEVVCADATEFLQTMPPVDLIFLDPARRDGAGRKTVFIEDCEPNVASLLPQLQAKAAKVIVKLSPMLDATRAITTLGCVEEVHTVSDGNECKELLLVLGKEKSEMPRLYIAEGDVRISLCFGEEANMTPHYSDIPRAYLYEPGPAVMKAGVFKWISAHYGIEKLHPNTHLYTGDTFIPDFPGRTFRVQTVCGFSKKDLRELRGMTERANLTTRNFPASVADLRRKLKLKDGGDFFLFATTVKDGSHRLIVCRK